MGTAVEKIAETKSNVQYKNANESSSLTKAPRT